MFGNANSRICASGFSWGGTSTDKDKIYCFHTTPRKRHQLRQLSDHDQANRFWPRQHRLCKKPLLRRMNRRCVAGLNRKFCRKIHGSHQRSLSHPNNDGNFTVAREPCASDCKVCVAQIDGRRRRRLQVPNPGASTPESAWIDVARIRLPGANAKPSLRHAYDLQVGIVCLHAASFLCGARYSSF